MREPHARPLKPTDSPVARETLAEDLLGLAGVVLVFLLLFVILPALVA